MSDDVAVVTLSSSERVMFAAFGGIYLGLTVAWLVAAQANQLQLDDRFLEAMTNFGEFFAIVAPGLWFLTTFSQLTKTSSRVSSLVIGLVVMFPFPLFFGVMSV